MKIGIITDIHENVGMLQEALKQASLNKCDELVCLGDIVGYDKRFYRYYANRSAKKCLEMIRSNCRWIVPGNHDLFAARRFPVYSDGYIYPDNWFSMIPEERKRASKGKVWCYEADEPNDLSEDDIYFLKSLPEYIITPELGFEYLFSHYIFPDFTGSTTKYVERKHQLKKLWDFMSSNNIRFCFSGHAHASFTGFAYMGKADGTASYFKAIHSIPSNSFSLGSEPVMILLLPLTGEKGKTGFSIFDTESMKLTIVSANTI